MSPNYFGKLVTYTSALRKPALIPFGNFNPADAAWLANIAGMPVQDAQATVAFSATAVIDTSIADVITMVLTADVTSLTLKYAGSSTPPTGYAFVLRLVQDSAGGHVVTFPTNVHVDAGFSVDQTPSRATIIPLRFNGTNWEPSGESFSVLP